jgi:beta-lactamase class A
MLKSRIYQVLLNQFSKLSAIRISRVTVGLSTLMILLASLTTKYLAEQFVKSSVGNRLNLQIAPSSPAILAPISTQQKLKSSPTPSPLPTVSVVVTSTHQKFKSPTPPPVPDWAIAQSLPVPSRQPGKQNLEVIYNLKKSLNFKHSQKLQAIINDVVQLAVAQSLPKKPLSVTLINAKTGETAGYQQDTPRYPASVIKMFWMVTLYAQIESGIWKNEKDFSPYVAKMIQESDNEAASFILDLVTGTRSHSKLNLEKFKYWENQRQQVNRFFRQANYKKISIIQKTFPIDYIHLPKPEGSESQLLENSQNWNRITTKQAARLLYEICYTKQAVSPQASQKMCGWLERDLNPKDWQPADSYDFNPVRAFFGESLSATHVHLYSKAGWTSFARAEAAMVVTQKSKATYILAIFAQDSNYADDVEIFPKMSRLVYEQMNSQNSK